MEETFIWLVQEFGIYAVFLLCMVEGDITLLLAGVLAKAGSFGNYSFLKVVFFGTSGAVLGDSVGYFVGKTFRKNVNTYNFYQRAEPRIVKLTDKFGPLSIFVSKYIYGIRAAWCIFYGVSGTPWYRFLLHDAISCFLWVLVTASIGYFFGSAIETLIGGFKQVGIVLLVVLVVVVVAFYLFERFYVAKKVEEASPTSIQELEKAAHITLHDISEGIQERLHIGAHSNNSANQNDRQPPPTTVAKPSKIESD